MSALVHKVDARFGEWNDMNGEDRARGAVAQPRTCLQGPCWTRLPCATDCLRESALPGKAECPSVREEGGRMRGY